jgi:hypothetical protein
VRSAFLGVLILIAAPTQRVHSRTRIPIAPYVPPSAFLTLSTAFSSLCLAGLFHPTTTSRIHLSGFCSRCQAVTASSATRTLLPFRSDLLPPSFLGSAGGHCFVFRVLFRAAVREHRQSV